MILIAGLTTAISSCRNDDEDPVEPLTSSQQFFLSASGESAEYVLTTDNLESGDLSIAGQGEELELSGYTWIFNDEPSVAVGLVYQQGDPGIGLGYHLGTDNTLQSIGSFQISSRFTSYGFFENSAITLVGGQTPADANGNALTLPNGDPRTDAVTFSKIDLLNGMTLTEHSIQTLNITGNGEQATFSGIVDMGNGTFLTGMVLSQARDESEEGGSSTGYVNYPDSCWVGVLDQNFNVIDIIGSDRISFSSGRFRSRYYSQIAKDDAGNAYVFSGSFDENTTKPCGALRINAGTTSFDDGYYFDIESLSSGYHFKRVWHITGDYFMLEFYNDITPTSRGASTRYGIVNMVNRSFNWVSGDFPSYDQIVSTGEPMAYNGRMYFPVSIETEYPTIFIINPETAVAEKGISVNCTSLNGVGLLRR